MKNRSFCFLICLVILSFGCTQTGTTNSSSSRTDSLTSSSITSNSNLLRDYKIKTPENEVERTSILDAVRNDLIKQKFPEFSFVVNHLLLKDGVAFLKADAKNKDGSEYKTTDDLLDCCHVEALLKNENGNWKCLVVNAFSTDIWYPCAWKEYNAPKEIFDYTETCE